MWHDSFSHHTNKCVVFRNAIQKTTQERRFKFSEIPNMDVNMVSI